MWSLRDFPARAAISSDLGRRHDPARWHQRIRTDGAHGVPRLVDEPPRRLRDRRHQPRTGRGPRSSPQARLRLWPLPGQHRGRQGLVQRGRPRGTRLQREPPHGDPVAGRRRGCRHRVVRPVPRRTGGGRASAGRREEGVDLGARQGRGLDSHPWHQRGRLRPPQPHRALGWLLHHELRRTLPQGDARRLRRGERFHDHHPRVHERPEPAGQLAQGPAPGTRGGDEHRPDVLGRITARGPDHPGAQGQVRRLRLPCAGADGLRGRHGHQPP